MATTSKNFSAVCWRLRKIMSPSSHPRIKRGPAPTGRLTRNNYRRRALPALRRDFSDRCAYCMSHIDEALGLSCMHVDHFDPRQKKKLDQSYDNLFLADAHCNNRKSDIWPTRSQRKTVRFLNCCKEKDYGEQIFEDPVTHKLVATTPSADYHITIIDLNAPHLIYAREKRRRLRAVLNMPAILKKTEFTSIEPLEDLMRLAERMIPDIPAPPENVGGLE